jgi:hypothetical protein
MADTVSSVTIIDGRRNVIVKCLGSSDGTGESDAIKIDLSALSTNTTRRGDPTAVMVQWIEYDVQGYNSITLKYDRGTDVVIAHLKGAGVFEVPSGAEDTGTGGTGDVTLTTNGAVSGASYSLVIGAIKKY